MSTVNLYDKRNMIAALDQTFVAKSFLLSVFFNFANPITHDTDKIDIDIRKTKRALAKYQNWRIAAKVVDNKDYFTVTHNPGYIKLKTVTTAEDILKRGFGEGRIYGPTDGPARRAQMKVGEDLEYLRQMIIRRMELQAAEALNTGEISISGDGIDPYVIDFFMRATHKITLTGTNLFSDANSQPIELFREWKRLIAKDSGQAANVAVFGSDAWDAYIKNPNVKSFLDNRRIELGGIAPRMVNGATFQGIIEGIELWSYDEWYYDEDTSSEKPMVPVDKVWLGATGAYTATHFAAIKDLKAMNVVPFFPKSWEEQDPSVRFLSLQSSPMVGMHQPDAFISAKVV